MMYWIASDYTQRRIDSLRAGMGVPHLFQWDINRLPIMFPAQQSDQTRIADFLDGEVARIDALVAKKRRMLRLLDIQWQATVSDRLWNASPYERVRLRHLAGRPTSGNRDHGSFSFSDDGVPCLRGINVKPAKIMRRDLYRIDEHASQEHAATILRAGDLVIVRSGFAGAAALVPSDLDGANCVDLVVVRKCSAIVPKYLEYVVNSREAQEQVRYGSSGALLTHFNAVDAGNLAIPVRNIETQKAIVEELDSRFEQVEKLRSLLDRQIDLLEEHRQALITAAVTGEMEVPGVSR
jgi:type I restriction enzyme S subunit